MVSESWLIEMHGYIVVRESFPSKWGAKEEVDITHPVDSDVFGQLLAEGGFMGFVLGVEYKIVNVETNVKWMSKLRCWIRSDASRVEAGVVNLLMTSCHTNDEATGEDYISVLLRSQYSPVECAGSPMGGRTTVHSSSGKVALQKACLQSPIALL